MPFLKELFSSALHLFFPHLCTGCGSDLLAKEDMLCIECLSSLPHTSFEKFALNKTERLFYGRLNAVAAHSEFYFTKGTLIQQLIHELKYRSNPEISVYLGKMMGENLLRGGRFSGIDAIVPLPLYADREFRRGYNQAEKIAAGISEPMNVPLITDAVNRIKFSSTQTNKHRSERWDNVAESFIVNHKQRLEGKHLLLVDDVITTGATLEACGRRILEVPNTQISVATLAIA